MKLSQHLRRTRMRRGPSWSERGSSLVGILVGIAIMGILAAVFTQLMANTYAGLQRFQISNDMQDLRRIVRVMIDCPSTKAANASWASCNGTARQEVRDRSGKVVIEKNPPPTKIGKYVLVMRCVTSGSVVTMRLEATRNGVLVTDDVFKKVPLTCPL